MGDETLIIRYLLLICALLLASAANADQVIELYRADALVKSQSEPQRAAAAKHALADTLVRVSGATNAVDNPIVRQALVRAQDFVYEYSYASTDEMLSTLDGEQVAASRLQFKFSAPLIEQLLRDANLTFWPSNRPTVLVWLVAGTATGRDVVSDLAAMTVLRDRAHERGLPLMIPLFDLEDHLAMPADALWQNQESQIREGSERYAADAIVVVRARELADAHWSADWQLLHVDGSPSFSSEGDSLEALLPAVIDNVADYFATRYAISPSEVGDANVVLQVNNVASFADYKKVEGYLAQLALVRRTQLASLNADGLTLKLFTEGDVARLQHTLALGGVLIPSSDSVSLPSNRYIVPGTVAAPLQYRLAR
ncbi:DUF2066 domain-containing protein [Gilvimarinus polysaccharolyticus]|uniref:DUF2066 domain-containing protein n=1 Tax=Gilvimarinus polysaccharolyticus TaxID=863921 RepID=UPI000673A973|nr:DUF2066 domain-containing protein [Gilvimarinus polysaccharolyticus]